MGLGLARPFPHKMDRWISHSTNILPGLRTIWRPFTESVWSREISPSLSLATSTGSEIDIDQAATAEQRLFLLGHLFGHTVQWNVDPASFEIGRSYQPPVKEDVITAIIAGEREAACYGLAMFHRIRITDIDQWFCDYTASDQAYLLHFYRTRKKGDFRSFWRTNAPQIEPKPVPTFTPTKRSGGWTGL
jgi:hypothetical protein